MDVNGDTGLTVLFNGDDISANVSNVNDTFTTTQLSVSRDSEKAITTSFANGIGVTVTASFGMLSFVLSLPEQFQNLTRGLMGNYNGDPMDDIVYRNGTMLAANVSDRMIHDFGQSCKSSKYFCCCVYCTIIIMYRHACQPVYRMVNFLSICSSYMYSVTEVAMVTSDDVIIENLTF